MFDGSCCRCCCACLTLSISPSPEIRFTTSPRNSAQRCTKPCAPNGASTLLRKSKAFVPDGIQKPSYIPVRETRVLPAEKPEIVAARKGGDFNRPIDGEDPNARSRSAVRRWYYANARWGPHHQLGG